MRMSQSVSRLIIPLLLVPMMLLNASCETAMKNKEALIGGAFAGAVGAGVGKAVGGNKGMLIGLAAGLASGALVGHYIAKQERDRTQAAASVGYRPEQGNLLTITEETVAPNVVGQGKPVTLNLKYTILRPEEDSATVKETREVRKNDGTVIHSETMDRQFSQGEQRITWEYPVKSDAQMGTYQITTTALVDDKQASKTVTFVVK